MGCNCGGGIQRMMPQSYLNDRKAARDIVSPKPSVIRVPTMADQTFTKIFLTIDKPTDLLKYLPTEKVVYFISISGSAESNYLKVFLPRVLLTHATAKIHLKYYEISTCNVLAPKISQSPSTIFVHKGTLTSTFVGVFDFHRALNEFLAIR